MTGVDKKPQPGERRPLVGGRGILAGMGIALAFFGVQFVLAVADMATNWTESILGVAFVGVIVWFAARGRGAIAGGVVLGLILLPVLAVLVAFSLCAMGKLGPG